MNDRGLIYMLGICFIVLTLAVAIDVVRVFKRLNAQEIRLQNMEHLLSLLASESRPSASLGPTNGLPAFAYEEGKGADIKIKRRAQRKPSNNSSKDDRRTEGQ